MKRSSPTVSEAQAPEQWMCVHWPPSWREDPRLTSSELASRKGSSSWLIRLKYEGTVFHVNTEFGSHSQSEGMNEVVSGLETRILTGIPHASQALEAHLHGRGVGRAHRWKDRRCRKAALLGGPSIHYLPCPRPGQSYLVGQGGGVGDRRLLWGHGAIRSRKSPSPPTNKCFFKKINLFNFIYFWLHWVFVAPHGLSLVGVSAGYSSLRCAGFSLRWLLLLRSSGSRRAGSVVVAHWAQ